MQCSCPDNVKYITVSRFQFSLVSSWCLWTATLSSISLLAIDVGYPDLVFYVCIEYYMKWS